MKHRAITIANANSGVVGVKLKSGEMIITTLVDKTSTATDTGKPWVLKHPCLMAHTGNNSVGLLPWLPYDASQVETLEANIEDQVLSVFPVPADLAESYLGMTGQKWIETPSRRIIV